jgi:TRAP-type mannitol/chloroaromatic compound transport system substrate-binding protein
MTVWKNLKPKAVGVLAGITLMAAMPAVQAAEYEWKMATGWGGGPLMEIGAKDFAENLKEASNGRFDIQVFPGGSLGGSLKVSETVEQGIAEMGHTWMGYDWGKDKTAVLFGGYAGGMSAERMLHWLYRAGGTELQREFRREQAGVISMPLFIRTSEVFLHSNKPVKSLEDLKGLKIRTAGAWISMARELGASPVTMPGAEVYTALDRGTIDATEWGTLWENKSPGFHKITKYVIIPGVHQPSAPFELVINEEAWDSLSKEDQQLVERVARQTTLESWMTIGQEDAKAIEFFKEQGNEIIELSDEVQQAAKNQGLKWATEVAEGNDWFAQVFRHQRKFEQQWQNADDWRTVNADPNFDEFPVEE